MRGLGGRAARRAVVEAERGAVLLEHLLQLALRDAQLALARLEGLCAREQLGLRLQLTQLHLGRRGGRGRRAGRWAASSAWRAAASSRAAAAAALHAGRSLRCEWLRRCLGATPDGELTLTQPLRTLTQPLRTLTLARCLRVAPADERGAQRRVLEGSACGGHL